MERLLRIGIWGFGRVGKAAALLLSRQGHTINVMDNRILTEDEQKLLAENTIAFINQDNPAAFFENMLEI